jgi:hypothetical protein
MGVDENWVVRVLPFMVADENWVVVAHLSMAEDPREEPLLFMGAHLAGDPTCMEAGQLLDAQHLSTVLN